MSDQFEQKHVFVINEKNRRDVFNRLWYNTPNEWVIEVKPPTRSLDQNAKLWPMLDDVAKQVDWYGKKLSREEWKDVFTASLKKTKVVPGIDGGFVTCGLHTSTLSKQDFSDLIELIYAFGTQHEVVWSERAKQLYDDWLIESVKNKHHE